MIILSARSSSVEEGEKKTGMINSFMSIVLLFLTEGERYLRLSSCRVRVNALPGCEFRT